MTSHHTHSTLADQAGVSVVEIVMAMFILAVMSIGVLPLMMGSVQASAKNRDLVAATSLANAQLATLQADFPNSAENSCNAVKAMAATAISDPSGSGATATISVGDCPADYPGTVTVKVAGLPANAKTAAVQLTSEILVVAP